MQLLQKDKTQKSKGFSLIEVLASLLILAGLLSIISQLFYGNNRRIRKARQLEKIASLLELKMIQLEEEFSGPKIVQLPNQDKGEFKNEENYFWSYQTQAILLPSPRILLSLSRLPESELYLKMAQILTDILSDSLVELELTVHYRGKGREVSYSLSSYFVNYETAPDFILKSISQFLPERGAL